MLTLEGRFSEKLNETVSGSQQRNISPNNKNIHGIFHAAHCQGKRRFLEKHILHAHTHPNTCKNVLKTHDSQNIHLDGSRHHGRICVLLSKCHPYNNTLGLPGIHGGILCHQIQNEHLTSLRAFVHRHQQLPPLWGWNLEIKPYNVLRNLRCCTSCWAIS